MLVGLIPAPAQDLFSSILYSETDSADSFRFTGLSPGEYSVFAIPIEESKALNRPNSLENLVRSGDRITLAPQAVHSVTLEVRNNASNKPAGTG